MDGTPKPDHTGLPREIAEFLSEKAPDFKPLPANRVNEFFAQREERQRAEAAARLAEGDFEQHDVIQRAVKYVLTLPPAIQGSNGSKALFTVARAVVRGFNLGRDVGFDILKTHYNPRCEPPWNDDDIRRKCDEAATVPFNKAPGWLLAESYALAPKAARPRLAAPAPDIIPAETDTQPTTNEPTPGPAPSIASPTDRVHPSGQPLPPGAVKSTRPVFIYNYVSRTNPKSGDVEKVGMALGAIANDILSMTGGWPKRLNTGGKSRLFAMTAEYQIHWLDSPASLVSWVAAIASKTGGNVYWGRGESLRTKDEFLAYMLGSPEIEQYEDIQFHPHYPSIPGVFYCHPKFPDAPDGGFGALDELLSHFRPATQIDRYLLKAMFLTLAWGGKLGGRPLFVIESQSDDDRPGQGSGKTTLATFASELVGGNLQLQIAGGNGYEEDVQKRLLSLEGRRYRVVLFDNVKGSRLSSAMFEGYITAPVISGRMNYDGEGRRPNLLTWIITANDPNMSRDLTQRIVPIRIEPPDQYDPTWHQTVADLIQRRRAEIIADIGECLRRPYLGDDDARLAWSRWADWEKQVLGRVVDPAFAFELISERRKNLDDDLAVIEIIREMIAEKVRSKQAMDPDHAWVKIPNDVLADIVRKECPYQSKTTNGVLKWLGMLRVPELLKVRNTKERCWTWKGKDAIGEEPIDWNMIPM